MGVTRLKRIVLAVLFCLSSLPALAGDAFVARALISGSWFDLLHDGEGFLIEILGPDRALVYWFTYDSTGDQVWIVGDGPIFDDRIVIPAAIITSGGFFGPGFDPDTVVRAEWGVLEFIFHDCDTATLNYIGPPEFGSGTQNLVRITELQRLGCSNDRRFLLGFTPFPYTTMADGPEAAWQIIENDGDIVAHHFDNGIPWPEALAGGGYTTYHPNIVAEWEAGRDRTPGGHGVYLAVTPLDISRNMLAPYRGEFPDTPLSELGEPWASANFDDEIVKTAFFNHVVNAVEFFRPDFVAFGIEVNLLLRNQPGLWDAYLELHRATYTSLRERYPSLPVFVSLTAPELLENFTDADRDAQLEAVDDLMEYSDYLGLSLYPWMSAFLTGPLPDDMFADLDALTDKPIVIAETGYMADELDVDIGDGIILSFEGTPAKQQAFIKDLLIEADRRDFRFIINFVPRDYDPLCVEIGCSDADRLWEDTGLYDEDGVARPALKDWREQLSRRLAR